MLFSDFTCRPKCTGYLSRGGSTINTCQTCDSSCGLNECKGVGTKYECTNCTGRVGKTLNPLGNMCVDVSPTCQTNEFLEWNNDYSNSSCKACRPECATCTSDEYQRCTSCVVGKKQYNFTSSEGYGMTCLDTCPTGTWDNSTDCVRNLISNCIEYESGGNGTCLKCQKNHGRVYDYSTQKYSCQYIILPLNGVKRYTDSNGNVQNCTSVCPEGCKSATGCLPNSGYLVSGKNYTTTYFSKNYRYYINQQNRTRNNCHNSCGYCHGGEETDCDTCYYSGNILSMGGKCVQCDVNKYADKNHTCQQCVDPNCNRCSNSWPRSCTSCNSGYILYQGWCYISSAIEKSYTLSDKIPHAPCHSSCATCSGPRPSECLSCPTNYTMYSFQSTVPIDDSIYIKAGYDKYSNFGTYGLNYLRSISTYECRPVPSNSQCESEFKDVSQIRERTHWYYLSSRNCQANWYLCLDFNCTTCRAGSFRTITVKNTDPTPNEYACGGVCGNYNSYPANTGDINCVPCSDANCLQCWGIGENKCRYCRAGYYLQEVGTTGLGTCKNTTQHINQYSYGSQLIINIYVHVIGTCHWSCNTCRLYGESDCYTCLNDTAHANRNILNPKNYGEPKYGQCVIECPQYKYLNETEMVCYPCISGCKNCTDNKNCTLCDSNRWLDFNKVESACHYTDCPCKQYRNPDGSNTCLSPCHSTCGCCDGPNENNCTSCEDPLWFHFSKCIETCPVGYYPYISSRKCLGCNPQCKTCIDSLSSSCTTCHDGYYFSNLNSTSTAGINSTLDGVSSSSCVLCPKTNYIYYHDRKCLPCHSSCNTCSLEYSSKHCKTCVTGKLFRVKTNECLNSCPIGTFQKTNPTTLVQECIECHEDCLACFGATNNNCLSCKKPSTPQLSTDKPFYVVADKNCIASCPSSTFEPTNSPYNCFACHQSCMECEGPTALNCTSCKAGDYKDVFHATSCHSSCPDYTYTITQNMTCQGCIPFCKACSGPEFESCSDCKEGYFKLENTGCDANCTYRFYQTSNTTCNKCHFSCYQCTGKNETQCTSCVAGSLISSNGTCQCIISNQYMEETTMQCEYCASKCKTCVEKKTKCLSCVQGMYLMEKENDCIYECPDQYFQYIDPSTLEGTCFKCHETCATCKGSKDTDCLTCLTKYYAKTETKGICADCSQLKNREDLEECYFVQKFELEQLSEENDYYTIEHSWCLQVTFNGMSGYKPMILDKKDNFTDYVKVNLV